MLLLLYAATSEVTDSSARKACECGVRARHLLQLGAVVEFHKNAVNWAASVLRSVRCRFASRSSVDRLRKRTPTELDPAVATHVTFGSLLT